MRQRATLMMIVAASCGALLGWLTATGKLSSLRLKAEGGMTRVVFLHRALGLILPEHRDGLPEGWECWLERIRTEWAPWYVVPADNKWATRAVVADILTTTLRSLDLRLPEVTKQQREALREARRPLEAE